MKIKASKQIIESILINLQPFLEKKDASQITSHIFFKTENGKCFIKATDSEIGLQIVTDQITVEYEGTFTANGKKLLDIIRILKDDDISLELLDNTLNIRQGRSKFKIPTFDSSSFPKFPTIEDKPKIDINSQNLIHNIKKISSSIDTNNPKFELNGALINIKNDSIDIVGTDTRRLSIVSIEDNSNSELSIIVPKKAILEIQKLFLQQITIYYDDINLIIVNDNYYFYTRLINGKFPDYQRIIPNSIKYTIVLPKKSMISSIKMITTISQEIKMTLLSDRIIFNSLSTENVEAKTELEINTGLDEKLEINYNSKYLLDFISQTDSDNFELLINKTNLPFIVKENNFMTIIMPIVI